MERLLGLAFAILLAAELTLTLVVLLLITTMIGALWEHSHWLATLVVLVVSVALVAFWRSRKARAAPQPLHVHPGISIGHIPITGGAGAIYMLQFVVWVLFCPAVGVFYATLLAGGILLAPIVFYVNRRHAGGVARVGTGSLLGVLCGLAFVGLALSRDFPFARIFVVAVAAGTLGAGVLIWVRRNHRETTIAPYRH